MLFRAFVACAFFAGCSKAEPPAPRPDPAPSTAVEKTVDATAPALAAPARTATPPSVVVHSDANPPGVPRLAGDLQTEKGLQYIDEVVGTGKAPEKGKKVKVHYTGWLTDGSKFDSSRDRDQVLEMAFDTGMVIKGWDIGLASMRVGGKRRLVIPGDLGYGTSGMGEAIPPDSVLVFDVELVDAE
ncbi:MAG: FKBP-type peptidyl-prolyl cis-trans isomerase [Kofleriaceae bacterium]